MSPLDPRLSQTIERLNAGDGLGLSFPAESSEGVALQELGARWKTSTPLDTVMVEVPLPVGLTIHNPTDRGGPQLVPSADPSEEGFIKKLTYQFSGVLWAFPDGSASLAGDYEHFVVQPPREGYRIEDDPFAQALHARNERLGLTPPNPPYPSSGPTKEKAQDHDYPKNADETAAIHATPEAFAMVALLSDYPSRSNMTVNAAAMRVVHHRQGALAKVYYDLSEKVPYDPESSDEDTAAALLAQVGEFNVSRDEALVCLYALARLLDSPDGKVDIGFTELLDVDGCRGLGKAERIERAKAYHDVLRVASAWRVHMRRPWREGQGKTVTVEQDSAMFFYGGPAFLEGQRPLTGMGWNAPPHGFTIHDAGVSHHMRANPKQSNPFGPLLRISRIPRGKAWGDWAVSIGLALGVFVGRVGAQHHGGTISYTRRVFLTTFAPHHDPEEILGGKNPGRAREYWAQAMGTLQEQGMIEGYDEPKNDARKGWAASWMDDKITVRLAGDWARIADGIQASSAGRIEAAKKRQKGPSRTAA